MEHRARKRFGQNFLQDESVIERMAAAIAPKPGEHIVEIGPGLGALTNALLEKTPRLDVIELDRDLAATLAERLGHPAELVIHQADALSFDYTALANRGPLRIVGNLPYNISTPLMFHLFNQAEAIADMHFMLQKEVVDRLTASPGGKTWGRLGVMTAARAQATALFRVPATAFRPVPKVESAVVRIVPKTLTPEECMLLPALEKVVRAAFGQRRKTLRNNLKNLLDETALQNVGIDPQRRAETLSLGEFRQLAVRMKAKNE